MSIFTYHEMYPVLGNHTTVKFDLLSLLMKVVFFSEELSGMVMKVVKFQF